MFNMFELFRQAQGGAAFDNLARAYGMAPEQMRAAAAALTPAFAQGFQRQVQNDEAARRFADLFQTESYARAFEAQAAALDPAARGAGENALSALFGSKEVSRAVAAQAAAASGVQAEIIRKVLPVLASILVGGFMKATQGSAIPNAGAAFPGPFGEMWSQMFNGVAPAGGARPGAPINPFESWASGLGQSQPRKEAEAPANPLGDMMTEMLNGMFGGATGGHSQTAAQTQAEPEPAPKPSPTGTGDAPRPDEPAAGASFDEMVETGRELSAQNAKAMERIFDAFFGGKPTG